jgi:hypothetical protein
VLAGNQVESEKENSLGLWYLDGARVAINVGCLIRVRCIFCTACAVVCWLRRLLFDLEMPKLSEVFLFDRNDPRQIPWRFLGSVGTKKMRALWLQIYVALILIIRPLNDACGTV